MAHYFSVAEAAVNAVKHMTSSENLNLIELHKLQCLHLQSELLEPLSKKLAELKSLPTPWNLRCKPLLREICRFAKMGEALVSDCYSEQWIKAAPKLLDSVETFFVISVNLEWCTAMLEVFIQQESSGGSWLDRRKESVEEFETRDHTLLHSEMCARSLRDKEILWRMLEQRQQHTCSNDPGNNLLLEYLLNRLDASLRNCTNPLPWHVKNNELVQGAFIAGGMYASIHKVTWMGGEYAQKTYSLDKITDFIQEVSVLSVLHHPHIVPLLCYSLDERECSLVMELMSKDLFKVLKERCESAGHVRPFVFPVALDIIFQIAQGMAYLHSKEVAHRDLKSLNILIRHVEIEEMGWEGMGYIHAKVADFGQSKMRRFTSDELHTTNTGTTRWRAPELFPNSTGERRRNDLFKADVYSFAVVCSEILTGEEPFANAGPLSDIGKKVADGCRPNLPSESSCPKELLTLIKRCWDTDPTKRPPFSEVCRKLRQLKGIVATAGPIDSYSMRELHGQEIEAPPYDPNIEGSKKDVMHAAFRRAATPEAETDSITRVLVVGKPGAGKTRFIRWMCTKDPSESDSEGDEIQDIKKEHRHSSLPLCMHDTPGDDLWKMESSIQDFLASRNTGLKFKSLESEYEAALKEISKRKEFEGESVFRQLGCERVHMVWLVMSVLHSRNKDLKYLVRLLKEYEVPWQIFTTHNDKDSGGEGLQRNVIKVRNEYFMKPKKQPEEIVTRASFCSTSGVDAYTPGETTGRILQRSFDQKNMWAASQVVVTKSRIRQTAKFIYKVAWPLGKKAICIDIAPSWSFQRADSLSNSAFLIIESLCEIWEVPEAMLLFLRRKMASWEGKEGSRTGVASSSSTKLTLSAERFLFFCVRIAGVILWIKSLHPKGWPVGMTGYEYSESMDKFYVVHKDQFKEYADAKVCSRLREEYRRWRELKHHLVEISDEPVTRLRQLSRGTLSSDSSGSGTDILHSNHREEAFESNKMHRGVRETLHDLKAEYRRTKPVRKLQAALLHFFEESLTRPILVTAT